MQGRFYFGEHLDDSTGCDSDVSAVFRLCPLIMFVIFDNILINVKFILVACWHC